MKTYRIAGTATDWVPNGNPSEVTRLEAVNGVGDASPYSIPVVLSMRGETTRKGVRRVVVAATASIPGTVLNDMVPGVQVDPKGSTPVSAHIVVQGPQLVFMSEQGNSRATGFLNLVLGRLTSDILAIATNESPSANADNKSLTGLLANALVGSVQLDTVSGTYGTTSAS